jgi:hypothetical protein
MKKTSISNALHIARQRKADGGKSVYLFQDPMGYLAKKGEQISALPGNIADIAYAAWGHPLSQAMRVAPGETSKAVGEFALEKGKQGVEYARKNPFGATRKVVDFATDWSADPRVILAKQLFSSTPANAGEDEFARQVQYGIRPAPEAEPPQYADGGIVRDEYAGGGDVVLKALAALRGAQKVFPKPQRMFPEGAQPPGGEYLNAATGEAITGQKPARAVIGVTPEGKPVFLADAEQVDVTGSLGPGSTKTKTNLFKQKAGWKWTEAPEGYENVPTIVSAENRGQHYYGLGADFPKGVDLERYADAPSEPRLRPTTQGNVYPGEQVGSISVRGREHPVYDMLTIRNLLAGTGAGAAGAAAMQETEPSQYAGGGFIRERHADGSRVLGALSKAAGDIAKKYAQNKALPQVQEAADLPGFLVYHGSPYKFEKFDISKIGTGEGNASYGPGLYFAEKEKVARGYRDKLAGPEGHMYEARINAPQEHFLDWNKPFHEQSEHVQNSLMNVPNFESFGHYKSGMDMGDLINRGLIPHTYDKASQEFLQAYRDAGIPGIKYLDQGSRVKGMADPTRNYVVFDDKLIDTMRRYAKGGSITAKALMLLSKKAKSRPGRR